MGAETKDLTTFDLYTRHRPGEVLVTDVVSDVCSGMNPCYYMRDGDRLKVSSSVAALILDSGHLEPNPRFKPPKFFLHPWQRSAAEIARRSVNATENMLRNTILMRSDAVKKIKSMAPTEMKTFLWNPHHSAHETNDSIDTRIHKLKPFQTVGTESASSLLEPDYAIRDLDEYLERSAQAMRQAINNIEADFPNRKHIILMGGKDSQLISLVPKRNEDNWYIFSAEPNHSLISEWVKENGIHARKIFAHDGRNEESLADFKRKVICSDLYTSPIHIRYLPTLEKLVHEFDGECIFWLGSMPRRTSLYDASHRKPGEPIDNNQFFRSHMDTFPNWQGNIHQTYSNYLGCPFLSPYYLPDMWFGLYAHLDPSIIVSGEDYRPRLGNMIAGRDISWPDRNPGPMPYQYWYFWFNSYNYYRKYINRQLQHR